MATKKLEEKLAETMLAAFHEAKRLKYNAARFFQMLSDKGALATAKTLLAGDAAKVSDGFTAMWHLKRLDLTVEAISLEPAFKTLFTEHELETARKRLENAGYIKEAVPSKNLAEIKDKPGIISSRLRVFLCHSSGDKPAIRKLYQRLKRDGFTPWLDEEDLIPGQDWRYEIPEAVRGCHAVLVCLSRGSITKEGYVQKEIKVALDVAEEKPQGTIFVIPALLEDGVNVPAHLGQWHWVNLFQENGYQKLVTALRTRADTIGINVPSQPKATKSLQIFNFNGAPHPIFISLSEHSAHGPLVDLRSIVTIVNYTQTPMKIALSVILEESGYALTRFFFRPRGRPEQFERISLLGNSKEDYELHFMFPDDRYPQDCSGQLLIQTDNDDEPFYVDVRFS